VALVPDTTVTQPDQVIPDVTEQVAPGWGARAPSSGLSGRDQSWGVVHHTWPAAGEQATAGATVTMFAEPPPLKR
jgi:hypothetical protein